MSLASASPSLQRKFSALAAHTSSALAVGAGLAMPFGVFAAPVVGGLTVQPINLTLDGVDTNFATVTLNGEDFWLSVTPSFSSVKSASGRLDFLSSGKFLQNLAAGTTVSADTSGSWGYYGILYAGTGGNWNDVGDHGYVGLRFDDGDGNYNYGWLEVTRGSITLGQFGYQNTAGAAAAIPAAAPPATAVPEPSSLLLLASGAAGVLALRRRRQQRAGAPAAAH